METEIDDTASRRRSRKTGATAPMGFTGGEPPFRSCRYAAPEPCPGIIACNTSEPAGSSLFRPPGKVRACGARSETSPTEWKPVPEQRDAADDPPGLRGWLYPYVGSRVKPGGFHPTFSLLLRNGSATSTATTAGR